MEQVAILPVPAQAKCVSRALDPTPDTFHMIFGRRAFFGYTVRPSGDVYDRRVAVFILPPSISCKSVARLNK